MDNFPKHIAIIVDGNRRFAKNKGKDAKEGHKAGADNLENFFKWAEELGVKEITAYVLSTENLKRDKIELEHLFDLFKKFFKKFKDSKEIKEKEVKIRFIGDLYLVPEDLKKQALELEELTKNNSQLQINFCFAYSGRSELVHAFNKLLQQGKKQIKEEDITNSLWLSSEPDMIIRTGNTIRTSNFLPWQSVYSEWFFLDKMWPELTKSDLENCIKEFQSRKRNFGK